MNLFHEYQTLARAPTFSPQDLVRMAEIVEIASSDEALFSAIMDLEYLLAQEDGLLAESNIQYYVEEQAQLKQRMETDLMTGFINHQRINLGFEVHK